MMYNGKNVLVIKAKNRDGCRSIVRKEVIIAPLVIKQYEEIVKYLDKKCSQHKSPPKTVDEMEMSILDTETWATQHWIFKYSKSMQDSKNQKTNKWLLHNFHQLSIDYGEQQKQLLIEYIPHVTVIDIEDLGCPRLDQICDEENLACCIFHKDLNPKQCTFYKFSPSSSNSAQSSSGSSQL
ncbi:Uncharacterized protein FWK35_00014215 [Aphis craccivora]|uniref:Uncharacterized protein n=1 Tax=Aphis craccivora TaxID=307492 RepID=A0A6G0Y808_APHCR|nr:Uncharacterized protein FWK35_00014215 [Aphis craccivora]